MNTLKNKISETDTQTLFDCYSIMEGTTMKEYERMAFALICDELESRGVIAYNEDTEEYEKAVA